MQSLWWAVLLVTATCCCCSVSAFIIPVHRLQSTAATAAVSLSSNSSRQRQRAIAPLYMAAAPKKDKSKKSKDEPTVELVSESKKNDIYLLKEPESGRVIECYPDAFAVIGSERYFVGHPCDWCVSIGRPDGQGGLEPIPLEGELMDEVFSTLSNLLEDDDVHLFRTPVTLTLQGDFVEDGEEYDSDDELEEDELDDDDDVQLSAPDDDGLQFEVVSEGNEIVTDDTFEEYDNEATDIESDNVDLIASFWHDKVEYSLVRHLDPMVLVAKVVATENNPTGDDKDGTYALLSEAESEKMNPVIEQLLQQTF